MTGLRLRNLCYLIVEIGLRLTPFSLTQVLMVGRPR